jgi:hypothetical protein
LDPRGEKTDATALPVDAAEASQRNVMYQVRFDRLPRRGFYEMQLARTSGTIQPVSFAVNLDPTESDLRRLDLDAVGPDYFGPQARLVSLESLASLVVSGGHNEIWPQILLGLVAVLGLEQFLAWWFGRKR